MIDNKTIQHIAKLARIKLTEKEEEKMKSDLSSILDYIGQLNNVNTDNVEPLYQTTGLINSMREDEVRGEFKMDEKSDALLIGQSPDRQERFIKVKSVLRK